MNEQDKKDIFEKFKHLGKLYRVYKEIYSGYIKIAEEQYKKGYDAGFQAGLDEGREK